MKDLFGEEIVEEPIRAQCPEKCPAVPAPIQEKVIPFRPYTIFKESKYVTWMMNSDA